MRYNHYLCVGATPTARFMISYQIKDCKCGKILVMSSHKGVFLTALSKSESYLESIADTQLKLARDLPPVNMFIKTQIDDVIAIIDGNKPTIDIDITCSNFSKMVYDYIREIPRGEVLTYEQLAIKVRTGKLYRSVIKSCNDNPLSIIIPCHRVVDKFGIGQYRWGLDIKNALLVNEGILKYS